MSAEQIGKLVEERKLREFRDGSNVLFKVSEVEALLADTGLMAAEAPAEEAPQEELRLEPTEAEAVSEEETTMGSEPAGELGGEEGEGELSLDDSLAMLSEPEEVDEGVPIADDSFSLLQDSGQEAGEGKEDTEVSFAMDEQQGSSLGGDLSGADTAITREGMSVIDESDSQFRLAEDTAGETKAAEEAASLEKIEEDVNLDTFGSGSGLLDLSLQADDTSLGGILDEIYTTGAEEGAAAPAEASAADVAAEAEQILAHDGLAGAPVAAMPGYIEPEPDTSSNIFGGLLLLPLVVVIYTLLVTIVGQFGALSSLVPRGMTVFYILGGTLVLGLAVAGYGWAKGAPAGAKEPKPKKEKAPKVKKEKPKKQKKK